jgi:hypothetical protein
MATKEHKPTGPKQRKAPEAAQGNNG